MAEKNLIIIPEGTKPSMNNQGQRGTAKLHGNPSLSSSVQHRLPGKSKLLMSQNQPPSCLDHSVGATHPEHSRPAGRPSERGLSTIHDAVTASPNRARAVGFNAQWQGSPQRLNSASNRTSTVIPMRRGNVRSAFPPCSRKGSYGEEKRFFSGLSFRPDY